MSDDEPKCESCGVEWLEHLGIEGTCRELLKADAAIKRYVTERKKMLEVIETLANPFRFGVSEMQSLVDKCRDIMAEIKAGET